MSPKSTSVSQWISLRFFTGMWARVTYRHRNVSKTAAPLKPTVSWWQITKAGKLELTAQTADIVTGWRTSLSCQLAWASSRKLVWSWFLLGIPAVPCFLWATGLRVVFRSLRCFSFLWVRVSLCILYWPRMCRRSDWLHTQFACLCDQDHVCSAPPAPVCWFACFVFFRFERWSSYVTHTGLELAV